MRTETCSTLCYDIKVLCWTAYFRLFVYDRSSGSFFLESMTEQRIRHAAYITLQRCEILVKLKIETAGSLETS